MIGNAWQLIAYLSSMPDEERLKEWELTEKKKKRSLDSNSYFHVLCDKLRCKLGMSMARMKNHLISSYGQIQYLDDGEPMIYKSNAPESYMEELETIHSKCVKVSEENNREVFFYRIYRGSHTYNTSEMNDLIKGTIEECKLQGIETATPDELAKMAALWEKNHG